MWKNLSKIKPNDTLIHMGDVALGRTQTRKSIVSKLPGKKKILIRGNHDRIATYKSTAWTSVIKEESQPFYIKYKKTNIFICHRPSGGPLKFKDEVYEILPYLSNSIILHGHVHNNHIDLYPKIQWRKNNNLMINCCVELWNYSPINIEQIMRIFNDKKRTP